MNILVVGPHPDDQELGMGGTIARLVEQGHDVLLLDMTNGEPTPHGDPTTRAVEAARAAEILGARRRLIDLPNRELVHSIAARHLVAGVIREHRADIGLPPSLPAPPPDPLPTHTIPAAPRPPAPHTPPHLPQPPAPPTRDRAHAIAARPRVAGVIREHRAEIVFTPSMPDAHPDHVATTRIVEDARFDAKLTGTDMPGEPIYPRWLIYYYCTHLRTIPQPSFLLDISGYQQTKRRAILAYETQFVIPEKNRPIVDWLEAAGTYFGSRIRTAAAEPFFVKEPLGLASLDGLT